MTRPAHGFSSNPDGSPRLGPHGARRGKTFSGLIWLVVLVSMVSIVSMESTVSASAGRQPWPAASDGLDVLLGSWSGHASGPEGTPPSGAIRLTFFRDPEDADKAQKMGGELVVTAEDGVQLTGKVSRVRLDGKMLEALVVFELSPEFILHTTVSGPLEEDTVEGSFVVTAKDAPIGGGSFRIVRDRASK